MDRPGGFLGDERCSDDSGFLGGSDGDDAHEPSRSVGLFKRCEASYTTFI